MALPSPPDDLTPEQLFSGHLNHIEEVITYWCRRSRLSPQDAEDFGGHVHQKLIAADYRVFREYRGKSSVKTYLTVVIGRLLYDFRDHLWGKWRETEEAKRLGPVAQKLERLLARDGLTLDEACQVLRTNDKVPMSELEIEALRARLPFRIPRRIVGEEQLLAEPAPQLQPDERLEAQERGVLRQRVLAALQRALATLPPDDYLLVRMRTESSVADISRALNMDQKPLYRRLEKIYRRLREAIEREGVRRQDVEEIFSYLEPDTPDF